MACTPARSRQATTDEARKLHSRIYPSFKRKHTTDKDRRIYLKTEENARFLLWKLTARTLTFCTSDEYWNKRDFWRRERIAGKLYLLVDAWGLHNTCSFTVHIYLDKAFQINVISNWINPLKTKGRLLYLKTQFVPHSKHFSTRL